MFFFFFFVCRFTKSSMRTEVIVATAVVRWQLDTTVTRTIIVINSHSVLLKVQNAYICHEWVQNTEFPFNGSCNDILSGSYWCVRQWAN